MESLWPWSARIAFDRDSWVFVEELRKRYFGKAIGCGLSCFPSLESAEPDREPASAEQLGGLGLADIVVFAPGFEPEDHGPKFSGHQRYPSSIDWPVLCHEDVLTQ